MKRKREPTIPKIPQYIQRIPRERKRERKFEEKKSALRNFEEKDEQKKKEEDQPRGSIEIQIKRRDTQKKSQISIKIQSDARGII